jgi:hypothetical protein
LDYVALLKQLKKDDKLAHEQKEAGMDPEKEAAPGIPKVKMSRADDAQDAQVVKLLEHIRGSAK